MMRAAGVVTAVVMLSLTACGRARIAQSPTDAPGWAAIESAYVACVQGAYVQGNERWQNGWFGNIWVNSFPRHAAGLCYQWQDLVFRAVAPESDPSLWVVRGIQVNRGTGKEHHAVLVHAAAHAPATVRDLPPEGAWVLDPWLRGPADVYALGAWLRERPGGGADAEFETLPHREGRAVR